HPARSLRSGCAWRVTVPPFPAAPKLTIAAGTSDHPDLGQRQNEMSTLLEVPMVTLHDGFGVLPRQDDDIVGVLFGHRRRRVHRKVMAGTEKAMPGGVVIDKEREPRPEFEVVDQGGDRGGGAEAGNLPALTLEASHQFQQLAFS